MQNCTRFMHQFYDWSTSHMIYKRSELGKGIGFTSMVDSKFKSCVLAVYFLTESDEKTAALNNLGTGVLAVSNSRYPTYAAMSEKLSELYGASVGSIAKKKGDAQILGLSASWLDDKYAIDGEDISGEMLSIITSSHSTRSPLSGSLCCITSPIASPVTISGVTMAPHFFLPYFIVSA